MGEVLAQANHIEIKPETAYKTYKKFRALILFLS